MDTSPADPGHGTYRQHLPRGPARAPGLLPFLPGHGEKPGVLAGASSLQCSLGRGVEGEPQTAKSLQEGRACTLS